MCGPAFAALGGRSRAGEVAAAQFAAQGGRLLSYAAAGALVAGGVSALGSLQAAGPLLRPIWSMVHVGAIVLGLSLLWSARARRSGFGAAGRWPRPPSTATSCASSPACRPRAGPASPASAGREFRAVSCNRRCSSPRSRPGRCKALPSWRRSRPHRASACGPGRNCGRGCVSREARSGPACRRASQAHCSPARRHWRSGTGSARCSTRSAPSRRSTAALSRRRAPARRRVRACDRCRADRGAPAGPSR